MTPGTTKRRPRQLEEGLFAAALVLSAVFLALAFFDDRLYFTLIPPASTMVNLLLELASVLVGFAIFIVTWEAYKQNRNTQGIFVATGYLAVAAFDLMLALAHAGMPASSGANSANEATYYWLAGRYWASLILLMAAFVPPASGFLLLRRAPLLVLNLGLLAAVLVTVTWFPASLPTMFAGGDEPARLKTALEFGVTGVCAIAALVFLRQYRSSGEPALVVVIASLLVTAFSVLAFTMHRDTSDVYNLLGHAYKVLAYYLLFRALLVTAVHRPYLQLRRAKEDLERSYAQLDEKNRELDALDDVAITLGSSLNPSDLMQAAIEKIMHVTKAGAGAVFLLNDTSGTLQLSAWRGLSAHLIAQYQAHAAVVPGRSTHSGGWRDSERRDPTPTRELAGMSRHSPGPLRTLSEGLGTQHARIAPLGTCACAPLMSKGRLIGTVAMIAGPDKRLTPRDVNLLTAIGF